MTHPLTEVKYLLTWKSSNQHSLKAARFASRVEAETWYDEKLAEGKKPKLSIIETTTIAHSLK